MGIYEYETNRLNQSKEKFQKVYDKWSKIQMNKDKTWFEKAEATTELYKAETKLFEDVEQYKKRLGYS